MFLSLVWDWGHLGRGELFWDGLGGIGTCVDVALCWMGWTKTSICCGGNMGGFV